jgi:hypothetical protein
MVVCALIFHICGYVKKKDDRGGEMCLRYVYVMLNMLERSRLEERFLNIDDAREYF